MAVATPRRVSHATRSGDRSPLRFVEGLGVSRRAVVMILWISAMLHAPLVPTVLFDWLREMLTDRGDVEDYQGGEAIIPLDLDITPHGLDAPEAPEEGTPTEPGGIPVAGPAAGDALDGGVDAAPEDELDAGLDASDEDAGDGGADAEAPAGEAADAGPIAHKGAPIIDKPLEAAGPQTLSDGNYVQVLLSGYRLRQHPLGARAGAIFTSIPEWRTFFAGSGIDPVTDMDNMLITGPQLRDSKDVVAVIEFNTDPERVKGAVDKLVQKTDGEGNTGEWLEGAPVLAARAKADKAYRIFALLPQRKYLVVLPVSKESELAKLPKMKPFKRSSAAGIVVYLAEPHKPFRRVLKKMPRTFLWLRLSLIPDADGGATLKLELQDQDPAHAVEHAKVLTKELNALIDGQVSQLKAITLGLVSRRSIIDEFEFQAETGTDAAGQPVAFVRTDVKVTHAQLNLILTGIEYGLSQLNPQASPPPPP